MKLTKEQLKKIIKEELQQLLAQEIDDPDGDGTIGSSFPSDVPFIEYEEAKDDSSEGALPQLRKQNGDKPVYFMTKIRDQDYPSVYTKWKPSSEDAASYRKMGIRLIWADSRYGIGNWSPKSIIGIHRHGKRMRKDAAIYGNYHYLPEEK
tara:strand:+ start:2946 stop:3395 length:450 start_codon:yes stop_codon:yes gene_type:complete